MGRACINRPEGVWCCEENPSQGPSNAAGEIELRHAVLLSYCLSSMSP